MPMVFAPVSDGLMNGYPPGNHVGLAVNKLPAPGPDLPPQTVLVDAGPLWGTYRITFVAKRNLRQGMRASASAKQRLAAASLISSRVMGQCWYG